MSTKKIVALSAGLGQPSSTRLLADRLVEATTRDLVGRGSFVEVEVVELRDLAHEVTDAMLTGFAPPALAEALENVRSADGVIAVTPVFSSSYSGLFKSFVDVMDHKALTGTPVLIGATGGTARHSLALEYAVRPLFAYLQAVVVPTSVFAASEDWGEGDGTSTTLPERVTRAAGEFAELVARHEGALDDPFAAVVPFDEQLRRLAVGGDDLQD
ncbi:MULTISPECIES: FMN reductase [unclassified Frigoribacterium]|uniref:FMN reductase n=1 Tax=unclassified Frigoribacterium TaxID=2627005 RepID=UPI001564B796|nr:MULTISPECIES: FMN reductase [unclassified Frigoribacterium]NQW86106.1 FMN reductase [Frigoribacterium sp. VKM Ac-2860]NQX07438.1 FMN reductase [Frigoribacterium sp. VKM Ac-2859]